MINHSRFINVMCLLGVLLFVALSFAPVLKADLLNWDDHLYLTGNPLVRTLDLHSIRQIFQQKINSTYVPLTVLSFAVEHSIAGLNPFIYHLTNLILHLVVTLLVFVFGRQLGLCFRAAILGALIFGLHPMHVESVAWVTERKDVLYALFYLGSLCLYWQYLRHQRWSWYMLSIVCGFLSVLSKPMAVTLPFIQLLCDWMYGRRLSRRMLWDKLPYFIFTIPLAAVVFVFHMGGKVHFHDIGNGVLIGFWLLGFHLKKFFIPLGLFPMYEIPQPEIWWRLPYLTSLLTLGASFWLAIWSWMRKDRWPMFAVMFFFISIVIVIPWEILGDRFMYLPSLGFCLLFGLGVDRLLKRLSGSGRKLARSAVYAAIILFIVLLSVMTFRQAVVWQRPLGFWNFVIQRAKNFDDQRPLVRALNNRGLIYFQHGDFQKALEDYQQAIDIKPDVLSAKTNKAVVLIHKGKDERAMKNLNDVIAQDPPQYAPYFWRGKILANKQMYEPAIKDFQKAIAINPLVVHPYNEMAFVYFAQGRYDEALQMLDQALAIAPSDVLLKNKRLILKAIDRKNH